MSMNVVFLLSIMQRVDITSANQVKLHTFHYFVYAICIDFVLKNCFKNLLLILQFSGSSIATSLCEGESKPKHVGLLKVNKNQFKMKSLKLKSVRPYIFDNMILSNHDIKIGDCVTVADSVSQYVDRYIENELMPKVAQQITSMSIVLNVTF